ncbi:hypothetical protein GQ53DRAFT_748784 [Thozetella sp. PMI_491]|nr:hypothetical protein GQ53DRAFT_748784 [Thozetella sp. PMI_491]
MVNAIGGLLVLVMLMSASPLSLLFCSSNRPLLLPGALRHGWQTCIITQHRVGQPFNHRPWALRKLHQQTS